MHSLSKKTSVDQKNRKEVEKSEKLSIYYHDFFDYPLTFSDLIKWDVSKAFTFKNDLNSISYQNNFFFLKGKDSLVYKRIIRERISVKKMEIAKKTSKIIGFIPSVKMVAVTGSLAMNNSSDKSDIDLMIITKSGSLWTTRIFAYLLICLFGIQKRSPMNKVQKDKLCLNMWLDESDLVWSKDDRNIYTAHEIAQIVPLVNKSKIYEKFLYKNRWILDYWPSAVVIKNLQFKIDNSHVRVNLLEKITFWFQYRYMKSKITREVITKTRAIFHPYDPGKSILTRLHSLD